MIDSMAWQRVLLLNGRPQDDTVLLRARAAKLIADHPDKANGVLSCINADGMEMFVFPFSMIEQEMRHKTAKLFKSMLRQYCKDYNLNPSYVACLFPSDHKFNPEENWMLHHVRIENNNILFESIRAGEVI